MERKLRQVSAHVICISPGYVHEHTYTCGGHLMVHRSCHDEAVGRVYKHEANAVLV